MNMKFFQKGRKKDIGEAALEYLMTHGWALLVIIVVVAAFYFMNVFSPATYVKSRCVGFTYFLYKDQKITPEQYTIHVKDGIRDIIITGLQFGDVEMDGNPMVNYDNLRDEFIVSTNNVPTGLTANEVFTNMKVRIIYDTMGGIQNNTDEAICSGRVVADEWTIDLGDIEIG